MQGYRQTKFLKPRVIDVQIDASPNHAKVVIEPFERGYGHTLGNALRRVLLSSMPGYAPSPKSRSPACCTSTRRIEGVQEDVVDILLNLKGVVLKHAQPRRASTLRLSQEGRGPGHGRRHRDRPRRRDHQSRHVIAHLTQGGKLDMQIKVERAAATSPAASAPSSEEQTAPIGRIMLDASFSPVRRVSYTVEAARVEQRTDLDKLVHRHRDQRRDRRRGSRSAAPAEHPESSSCRCSPTCRARTRPPRRPPSTQCRPDPAAPGRRARAHGALGQLPEGREHLLHRRPRSSAPKPSCCKTPNLGKQVAQRDQGSARIARPDARHEARELAAGGRRLARHDGLNRASTPAQLGARQPLTADCNSNADAV